MDIIDLHTAISGRQIPCIFIRKWELGLKFIDLIREFAMLKKQIYFSLLFEKSYFLSAFLSYQVTIL